MILGRRVPALVLAALGALGTLGGCTGTDAGPRSSGPAPATGRTAASTAARSACPASYAAPDPGRPRMALTFAISADHRTVQGRERITFTPDLPIRELVFRLTANSPAPVAGAQQTSTQVTTVTADHGARAFTVTPAGAAAGTQGGLLRVPYASVIPAGTTVTATIVFTLALAPVTPQDFPRYGAVDGFAYFGSGAPLLSWERGHGWHTEDLVGFPAETATSEAMDVRLAVTAPAADTVIMSGDPLDPPRTGATRTWRSRITAARDVSVAAGPFAVSDTLVGGVRLRLGAPDAATRDLLVPQFTRAVTALAKRFGPFPFPSLSVARIPISGGGIEYPSSILLLDDSRAVAVHETAHQWFYAMVGDSQAEHPWLDEAFAQYAEEQIDGSPVNSTALDAVGDVDASVASYGADSDSYYSRTYGKGSAALAAARTAAGPARFDAALRCYVAANAWRIVRPADLARALASLPAAISVLRKAGALR